MPNSFFISSSNTNRPNPGGGISPGEPYTMITNEQIATKTFVANYVSENTGTIISSTLSDDFTVTVSGSLVLAATASSAGLYVVEFMLGGVYYNGAGGLYDGALAGYVIGDIAGEADQTNYQSNFTTMRAVTGLSFFERGHGSVVYTVGTDIYFKSAGGTHNTYDGTLLGSYQYLPLYLTNGGTVELYLRHMATTIDGGYHRLLAGSKIQLRKIATWTYPAAI